MYEEYLEIIEGDKETRARSLFALPVCGWSQGEDLLDDDELKYRFVYVDLLEGDAQKEVFEEVKTPRKTFPTLDR